MSDAILLIDDDAEALRGLGSLLEKQGFEVARELDGAGAVTALDRLEPDVAIVDLGALSGEGADLLALLKQRGVGIIGLLDQSDESGVAQGYRRGADHVLVRPSNPDLLVAAAARVAEASRLRRAADLLMGPPEGLTLESLGTSSTMRAVAQQISSLAQSDRTTVLITGEHGAGKAWAARLIHQLGGRAHEPFLETWCSGSGAVELETRLFGYERGAVVDGKLYDTEQVTALSKLPTKDQLRAQLVATIQGPLSELVRTFQAPHGELVRTLQAFADKQQGGNAEAA